ncbi:reverse transcriptase domain-containing protein [Tanacetum coccineum]
MGVKNLEVNVDSKLVANQVNGTYIAKETDMIKYLEKVKALTSTFQAFSIKQVPRSKNKKANALSKMASTSFVTPPEIRTTQRNGNLGINNQAVIWIAYTLKNTCVRVGRNFLMISLAHRTMIKSSNGDTPFSLTYGMEAVIPAFRTAEVDVAENDEALEINLELLEERREQVAIREAKSKRQMEKYYNINLDVASFKPGDLVYRSNEASRVEDTGKLGPKWEGPYEVTEALGKGSYKLKDRNGKELPGTWNVCKDKELNVNIERNTEQNYDDVGKAKMKEAKNDNNSTSKRKVKEVNKSNRFTLLDSLVNEDELVPCFFLYLPLFSLFSSGLS